MVWFKSIGFGLMAVVLLTLCFILSQAALLSRRLKIGQVVWNPISALRHPAVWLLLIAVFAFGFAWEYRRLAH